MLKWYMMLKSWHTTAVGVIGGLLIALPQIQNLLDSDPETAFVWSVFVTGLTAMGIGIFAKDGDKSSEDVGVK